MDPLRDVVLFSVEGKNYGVISDNFERVFRAVSITPLPNAPSIILGVINIHGEIVPVINLRERFSISHKEIKISDKIILLKFHQKRFAIVVDEIVSMLKNQTLVDSESIYKGIDYVDGVIKNGDEIVAICNAEKLYQPSEEKFINESISESQ
jgi:purine-binding chemotaxis protein CheW